MSNDRLRTLSEQQRDELVKELLALGSPTGQVIQPARVRLAANGAAFAIDDLEAEVERLRAGVERALHFFRVGEDAEAADALEALRE